MNFFFSSWLSPFWGHHSRSSASLWIICLIKVFIKKSMRSSELCADDSNHFIIYPKEVQQILLILKPPKSLPCLQLYGFSFYSALSRFCNLTATFFQLSKELMTAHNSSNTCELSAVYKPIASTQCESYYHSLYSCVGSEVIFT